MSKRQVGYPGNAKPAAYLRESDICMFDLFLRSKEDIQLGRLLWGGPCEAIRKRTHLAPSI